MLTFTIIILIYLFLSCLLIKKLIILHKNDALYERDKESILLEQTKTSLSSTTCKKFNSLTIPEELIKK